MSDSDTEEPWSSYRKLNAGLSELVGMLNRAGVGEDMVGFALGLAQQAKTVETAAMTRALQYVMDTVIKDASTRAIEGENVVYTVSMARQELQHLIDQVTP